MSLRERIENNPAVVLFLTLVAGFSAGVGAYQAVLEIAQLEVVPKTSEIASLGRENEGLRDENLELQAETEKIRESNAELVRRVEVLTAQASEEERRTLAPDSDRSRAGEVSAAPTQHQITPGKVQVVFRDGTVEEYDTMLYMSSKPPGRAFDLYTKIADPGPDGQREIPMANVRMIEFGNELRTGRHQTQVFETRVELLNGSTAHGWQYGARSFYLVDKSLPEAARLDLSSLARISFYR